MSPTVCAAPPALRQPQSRWGGNSSQQDQELLDAGLAARCTGCKRITKKGFLVTVGDESLCPECLDARARG